MSVVASAVPVIVAICGASVGVNPAAFSSAASTPGSSDDALILELYEYFNLLGPQDSEQIAADDPAARAGEAMQRCMEAAGFVYLPPMTQTEALLADPRMTLEPDEFADRYGLGITADQLGLLPRPALDQHNASQDYVDSLSPGQRDAYFARADTCAREIADDDRLAEIRAMNAAAPLFAERVESDERVAAAIESWSGCLAEAGFSYEDPRQMRASFATLASVSEDRDALSELLDYERRVALANVPCEGALNEVYRDVIVDRFPEFKTLYETAVADSEAGEEPPASEGGIG